MTWDTRPHEERVAELSATKLPWGFRVRYEIEGEDMGETIVYWSKNQQCFNVPEVRRMANCAWVCTGCGKIWARCFVTAGPGYEGTYRPYWIAREHPCSSCRPEERICDGGKLPGSIYTYWWHSSRLYATVMEWSLVPEAWSPKLLRREVLLQVTAYLQRFPNDKVLPSSGPSQLTA